MASVQGTWFIRGPEAKAVRQNGDQRVPRGPCAGGDPSWPRWCRAEPMGRRQSLPQSLTPPAPAGVAPSRTPGVRPVSARVCEPPAGGSQGDGEKIWAPGQSKALLMGSQEAWHLGEQGEHLRGAVLGCPRPGLRGHGQGGAHTAPAAGPLGLPGAVELGERPGLQVPSSAFLWALVLLPQPDPSSTRHRMRAALRAPGGPGPLSEGELSGKCGGLAGAVPTAFASRPYEFPDRTGPHGRMGGLRRPGAGAGGAEGRGLAEPRDPETPRDSRQLFRGPRGQAAWTPAGSCCLAEPPRKLPLGDEGVFRRRVASSGRGGAQRLLSSLHVLNAY